MIDVGYFHCNNDKEPYEQWFKSGDTVNGDNSVFVSGESVALGGRGGTVLAVGDPEAATVRLFDKVGSMWVQRGEALEGPIGSRFGWTLSLSTGESENVSKNKYSAPIVTLSVGAYEFGAYEFGLVRVYKCQKDRCEQIGVDIPLDGYANSVSLSRGEIPIHFIPYDRRYYLG
jgi:hypothetical protein